MAPTPTVAGMELMGWVPRATQMAHARAMKGTASADLPPRIRLVCLNANASRSAIFLATINRSPNGAGATRTYNAQAVTRTTAGPMSALTMRTVWEISVLDLASARRRKVQCAITPTLQCLDLRIRVQNVAHLRGE